MPRRVPSFTEHPASVGESYLEHMGVAFSFGGRMLAVIVLSTWIGLAVTALALHWLGKGEDAEVR